MNPTKMLIGLAPWVLFSMVAEHLGASRVGLAALLACAGSLVLVIRSVVQGEGVKLIDAAGVVTFAAIATVGLLAGHDIQRDLVDYGRGGSALVLAAVMAVSAFTVPFTEQYARATVDKRYWGSPVFRALNRKISLLWAGVILVMAGSHLTSGILTSSGSDRGNVVLNWVIPVLLLMAGLKKTEEIVAASSASNAVAVKPA